MKFEVYNDRIQYNDADGKTLAEIDFMEQEPGTFEIYHTYVAEELRGQHIASQLVTRAIDEIHRRGGKVTATCSYAQAWMQKHQVTA